MRGDQPSEDPGSVRSSTGQSAPPSRPPGAYLCSQCLTVFGTADQLAAHRATHEPPPPAQTQTQPARAPSPAAAPRPGLLCAASFSTAAALKKHVAREHAKGKRKSKVRSWWTVSRATVDCREHRPCEQAPRLRRESGSYSFRNRTKKHEVGRVNTFMKVVSFQTHIQAHHFFSRSFYGEMNPARACLYFSR